MKNKLIPTILALFLSTEGVGATTIPNNDADIQVPPPVAHLYGDSIEFDIVRNGVRIGSHNVTFEGGADALSVVTDFQLEVGALFITFFEMTYRSEALWQDGKLTALSARTNRNGEASTVKAKFANGLLRGEGPNGPFTAPLGIYPTNHWNAGVKASTQLINTITGKVSDVRLLPLGTEKVKTERGLIEATKYKYDGAIENEIWYDGDGRWVRMQFPSGDGSLIELHCRKCFPREMVEGRQ
ncbi:MAG: hypothetical protein KUG61_01400 [Parvibaculaceae bacterium]|nr:hypothetical protein [Parvibaculaceae bacterium]